MTDSYSLQCIVFPSRSVILWLETQNCSATKCNFVVLFKYISNKMQRYTVYFIWKLLYMFRVVPPPIIRSANNCTYSIWYLSHRYCYLPLSWKSWNCIAVPTLPGSSNVVTNTRCCRFQLFALLMKGGGTTRNMWSSFHIK